MALVLAGGLFACDNRASPDPSASATSKPSASIPKVALPDYCKRVCEKAIACGKEAALRIAGNDTAVRETVEKAAVRNTSECVDSCGKEAASEARLALSDKCTKISDCEAFEQCVIDMTSDFRR